MKVEYAVPELHEVIGGDAEGDQRDHGESQSNFRKGASVEMKETASPAFVSGLNDHGFVTIPPDEGRALGGRDHRCLLLGRLCLKLRSQPSSVFLGLGRMNRAQASISTSVERDFL